MGNASITVIDPKWAIDFAEEWIAAWNSHDLERIFSHYTDDFEMVSPLIIQRMGEPSGRLRGKDRIRPYWQQGLAAQPPLRFELVDLFVGVDSVTIHYRSLGRGMAAEVLTVNAEGKTIHGVAHYASNV